MKPLPPSDPHEPTDEQKARELEQQQIRLAYGQFFGSENGKLILKDLQKRYGFDESGVEHPIYRPGQDAQRTAQIDGMREPVRYIMRWQNFPAKMAARKEKQKRQPKTATQ